eukprot:4372309-Prymnesium_polylepis.1
MAACAPRPAHKRRMAERGVCESVCSFRAERGVLRLFSGIRWHAAHVSAQIWGLYSKFRKETLGPSGRNSDLGQHARKSGHNQARSKNENTPPLPTRKASVFNHRGNIIAGRGGGHTDGHTRARTGTDGHTRDTPTDSGHT